MRSWMMRAALVPFLAAAGCLSPRGDAPPVHTYQFSLDDRAGEVRQPDVNGPVLLVGQPTRGVDIGAIEFIHRELVKSRDEGCAVLVVSVELDEILSLADRVLVMFAGRITGEVAPDRADEKRIGLMMTGSMAEGSA